MLYSTIGSHSSQSVVQEDLNDEISPDEGNYGKIDESQNEPNNHASPDDQTTRRQDAQTPSCSKSIQEGSKKRKKGANSLEDTLKEYLQTNETPIKSFFASLADRAELLSRKQQAELEQKCLKAVHSVEFAEKDKYKLFFEGIIERANALSPDGKREFVLQVRETLDSLEEKEFVLIHLYIFF